VIHLCKLVQLRCSVFVESLSWPEVPKSSKILFCNVFKGTIILYQSVLVLIWQLCSYCAKYHELFELCVLSWLCPEPFQT
jgi:hypothetical protein